MKHIIFREILLVVYFEMEFNELTQHVMNI